MYPYDHASKFVKDIRSLGLSQTGKSFLDEFRKLITEIGNALGYVRMVRSAASVYSSEAVKFVPDLDKEPAFKRHASGAAAGSADSDANDGDDDGDRDDEDCYPAWGGFSDETRRAAGNMDEVINTLVKNFTEGNDYFKVQGTTGHHYWLSLTFSVILCSHLNLPAYLLLPRSW
jgi:WASH complex subunit 7